MSALDMDKNNHWILILEKLTTLKIRYLRTKITKDVRRTGYKLKNCTNQKNFSLIGIIC